MRSRKTLIAAGLVGMLLIGVVTPVTAHETQNVEGYDITFGGADEPLITGERMWLEIEVIDNESGEPVEGQADTLNINVEQDIIHFETEPSPSVSTSANFQTNGTLQ